LAKLRSRHTLVPKNRPHDLQDGEQLQPPLRRALLEPWARDVLE
jgi:hypothetical protein